MTAIGVPTAALPFLSPTGQEGGGHRTGPVPYCTGPYPSLYKALPHHCTGNAPPPTWDPHCTGPLGSPPPPPPHPWESLTLGTTTNEYPLTTNNLFCIFTSCKLDLFSPIKVSSWTKHYELTKCLAFV